MKHLAIVLISFSLLQPVAAQYVFSRMQYDWGGNKRDYLANILPLPGKQYLVGGTSQSDPYCTKSSICYGGDDMAIFVLDDDGNKVWEKSYGGTGSDKLWDVQQVASGGYILVGETTSGPSGIKASLNYGKEDIWIVRIDAAGNLLWERTYGSSDAEQRHKSDPDRRWWFFNSFHLRLGCFQLYGLPGYENRCGR